MFKKLDSRIQLFKNSMILTVIFCLVAHGYRFFNTMFSGDSLYMIYQDDSAWQVAIGRIAQPVLVFLRGGIGSPFWIFSLVVIFLGLAAFFMLDFLEIKDPISVILVTVVLTCNHTITAASATYLLNVDFYAFALFMAVFGIWLVKQGKILSIVLGTFCLAVSIGTYQAYICVAIGLVMIHYILRLFKKTTFVSELKSLCCYLGALAAAAGIYYLVWKMFQKIFGIWTSNSYNGLASVGDYSETSFFSVVVEAYRRVFIFFANPDTFTTLDLSGISLSIVWTYLLRVCNIAVVLVILWTLIYKNIKCKTPLWQWLLQILILLMLPLGINFVCVISKGMEHGLMIYAFNLVYVLAIKLASDTMRSDAGEGVLLPSFTCAQLKRVLPGAAVFVCILTLTWSNVVYANQVYLKKDLQEKATESLMTRIVYEIETTEGYEAGVTPVAFYGSFELSPYLTEIKGFENLLPVGMGKSSLTYVGTDYAFLEYILNVNMNLIRVSGGNETIAAMPTYPAKGSVAFVDGVLVVKISE